jgi:hypothetical protein
MPRGHTFCLLFVLSIPGSARQAAGPPQSGTAIQIVEGDGAINSIRLHRGHDPVVRVVNGDGEPVTGAAVTFLLPATGPSATFPDGGLSLTENTDDHGMAAGRGLRPTGVPGQFRIRVNTSWHGSPAVATLVQTNAEPVLHSKNKKTIAIIVLIAGAAAGGAAAALSHSSSSNPGGTTSGSSTGGTIMAGTPTLGPPH